MERYSVAIRTLGLNPGMLRRELESIHAQTVAPERVLVYIAEGYEIPAFRVGIERYVPCPKGMVSQRARDYAEVETPLLLLLDDDVVLAPDTAERLIGAMGPEGDGDAYDCMGTDVFANHRLPLRVRLYAALTNLTLPHWGQRWAFRIRGSGSFSYISRPRREVYPSQSAGGPCAMWRTGALRRVRLSDELWLDSIGFAYNDDFLEFYKLHSNGGRLGVHFNSGAVHADGKTASGAYRRRPDAFRLRAKAQYMVWHRALYRPCRPLARRLLRGCSFWLKAVLQLPVCAVAAVCARRPSAPLQYVQGLCQGVRQTRGAEYRGLPPYITGLGAGRDSG